MTSAERKHQQMSKETKVVVDEGARSFVHFLQGLDDGIASDECDRELNELGRTLLKHNLMTDQKCKGELALTLKITVDNRVATCSYELKTKEPKRRRGATTLFMTDGGNFSRELPKQLKLTGIHPVASPPAPISVAAEVSAPIVV